MYQYSNLFKGADDEELNQIRNIYFIVNQIIFPDFGVYRLVNIFDIINRNINIIFEKKISFVWGGLKSR